MTKHDYNLYSRELAGVNQKSESLVSPLNLCLGPIIFAFLARAPCSVRLILPGCASIRGTRCTSAVPRSCSAMQRTEQSLLQLQ